MKIAHINTCELTGGAARATFRLHTGLRSMGQDSNLVVCQKQSSNQHTYLVSPDLVSPAINEPSSQVDTLETDSFHYLSSIQKQYINNNRTALSNSPFSFPSSGLDVTQLNLVQVADIIHLHWIAGFQSLMTINSLLHLGKPIVWTLHDMWPFTGGCHSSGTCTQYQLDCYDCPAASTRSVSSSRSHPEG